MKRLMSIIVPLLIFGFLEGQKFNTARQPVGSVEQLPEQRISRITPAPHSPARNPGRVPVDPHALTLVPIRPNDRGSQPHGAISKAKMGYEDLDPPRDNAYVKGELCLEFLDIARGVVNITQTDHAVETGIAELDALNAQYGATAMQRLVNDYLLPAFAIEYRLDLMYVVRVDESLDMEAVAAEYRTLPMVKCAHPNYIPVRANVDQNYPDDPFFDWGSDITQGPEAWNLATGSNADTLGIIDSEQFFTDHPDLDDNYAGVAGGTDPIGIDSYHGTACVSHACGELNNTIGIASSAGGWDASGGVLWMPYRIASAADNVTAVSWMVANGACVISQSVVYPSNPEILEDAFANGLANEVLSFAAAGNSNNNSPTTKWPAYYDCVVAVGGVDNLGRHYATSMMNGSNYGDWIDVTGPAGEQYVCDTTGYYVAMDRGTSFSAPRVAGIAALVANQSGLRGEALKEVICRSADASNHLNENLFSWGAQPYGLTGHGRINAYEALMIRDRNVSVNLIRISSDLNPYVNCYAQYLDFDSADSVYGHHSHSVVPGVPVYVEPLIQNRGISDESFYTNVSSGGYIDDKLQTLPPGGDDMEPLGDPWIPPTGQDSCTLTVYTSLTGDMNTENDTFMIILACSYTDTVQVDGGDYSTIFDDAWPAWAMCFNPERPCTLKAIQICADVSGSVGDACTLIVWENLGGIPGNRIWSQQILQSSVVDEWNTFAGFNVLITKPVYIGLKTRGDGVDRCNMCADQRWNSGRFWFSASGGADSATDWSELGFDALVRPVVRYVTVFANDVGVLDIDAPDASVRAGTGQTPRATVKNYGSSSASFNVSCVFDSAGTTVYSQSVAVTDLAPYSTADVVWTTPWVPGWIDGTYRMHVYTSLAGDAYPSNDTLSKDVSASQTEELDAGDSAPVWGYSSEGYYAVRFEPNEQCSVMSGRLTIHANKYPIKQCSLYVWKDNDGRPGVPVRGPIEFSGEPYRPNWCTVDIAVPYATDQPFWLGCYAPGLLDSTGKSVMGDNMPTNGRSWSGLSPLGPWSEVAVHNLCIHALVKYHAYNDDISVRSIDAPASMCKHNFAIVPKATIKNIGRQTKTNFNIVCEIESLGTYVYTSTKNVASLLPTEQLQVAFDPWTPGGLNAGYNVRVTLTPVSVPFDDNPYNDTLLVTTNCTDLDEIKYYSGEASAYFMGTEHYAMQRFTPELPCSLKGAWVGLTAPFGWGAVCSTFVWNEADYTPARDWPGTLIWSEQWQPISASPYALFRIITPPQFYDQGEDFYIGLWMPLASGPYLTMDRWNDHGRSWYDSGRDSTWWEPLDGDWALTAIVKYLGGTSHVVRGYINGGFAFSGESLHCQSYLLKNPQQALSQASPGGAVDYLGNNQGLWQTDCRYFWPAWTWRDRLVTIVDYETGSGTTSHEGFYAVMIDTLVLEVDPQEAPSCSLRAIPQPSWSLVYWWQDRKIVRLSWNMPATDAGQPDTNLIAGYTVYRSTDGINFTHLLTLEGRDDTTFNDTVYPPYSTYYYAIRLVYTGSTFAKEPLIESRYLSAHTMVNFIGVAEEESLLPTTYAWGMPYPNPATQSAVIRYAVPQPTSVKIQLFDVVGRLVATLVDRNMAAGYHDVVVENKNLASGIYYCRLTTDAFEATHKLILTR